MDRKRLEVPMNALAQKRLVPVPAARDLAGEDRLRLIAEAAYYRAERRGFAPGRELEDWLAAEIEIDALFDDDER
jgi:hypothetical protein